MGAASVPNGNLARSRPSPSTRNTSAVCAMPYPAAEPSSIRAYFTPQRSAFSRTSAGVPVSAVSHAGRKRT